jgi:EXS family
MIGVFQPSAKHSSLWLISFVVATLYQIWWDVVMDWGLVERRKLRGIDEAAAGIFSSWQLRQDRAYSNDSIYYGICSVNILLRFCWTLSFLPSRYLSRSGVLSDSFAGSDELHSLLLGPLLASAELVRRTLWGLLRVEWEIVKSRQENRKWSTKLAEKDKLENASEIVCYDAECGEDNLLELAPMRVEASFASRGPSSIAALPSSGLNKALVWFPLSDMSSMNEVEVLGELCLYAATFCFLGMVWAAHRGTA